MLEPLRLTLLLLIIVFLFVVYFAPTFIAVRRETNKKEAIFALNLLLGWTFLGWVAALVWALSLDSTQNPKS